MVGRWWSALPFLDWFPRWQRQGPGLWQAASKRFGSWFWGLGMNEAEFVPKKTGLDYDLPNEIVSLEPVRQHVNVLTGFDVFVDAKPNNCHHSGWISLRTGTSPSGSRDFPGETIDVTIAAAIGRTTRFRSLNVTATGDARDTVSYEGQTSKNSAESSPVALYQKLFGAEFQDPNSPDFTPSPRTMAEQSVLSGVLEKANELGRYAGASDRARLDQYFTGLREIERQLEQQLTKPDPIEACRVPNAPQPDESPGLDVDKVAIRHRLMTDLVAMALMCDQTRVYGMVYSNPFAATTSSGRDTTHHGTTHEEPIDPDLGYQPQASWYTARAMEAWSEHVAALAKIREGDGTLLDNMFIFAHSDQSLAKIHGINGIPMFTAGRAGGLLKTGVHVAGKGEAASRLGYTALRVMGLETSDWGTQSNRTSKVIGEIIA